MTMTTCAGICSPAGAGAISVYRAIGGRAGVTAAVDGFCRRLLAGPALVPFFPGGVGARHRACLVTILGEAPGGPERYRGPGLAGAHRGLGVSDAHFARAAGHLAAALDELAVPGHLAGRIVGIVAGLGPAVVTG